MMGAFEMMGAMDALHRGEHGYDPARLLTGRAADLAAALIPMSRVKPVLLSRYLVKGWLDRGAMSVVYGESNVGKTFLALDLAAHVAAGLDWHGHRVPAGEKWAGPVLYIASEGGTGIRNRMEAMRRENPELDGDNLILLPTRLDLCTSDDSQWLVEMILTKLPRKPSLMVVDTLARAMGNGDENTAKDMGQFVRSVDHLREATGAHVMVIHHSGKDASKGARGSRRAHHVSKGHGHDGNYRNPGHRGPGSQDDRHREEGRPCAPAGPAGQLEARMNRPQGDTRADDEPSVERKAFANYLRLGDRISFEDQKALNETSDTQGGFLAPPELSTEVLRDLVEFSLILDALPARPGRRAFSRRHHHRGPDHGGPVMRAGRLTEMIQIERATESLNDYGTPSTTWARVATVRAELVQQSTT